MLQKFLALSTISLMAVVPVFADNYYDQGEKLYTAGDYNKAAQCFSQSLRVNPNSRSLYYAACCFLKLNNIPLARSSFSLLVDNFPQSPEAKLARTAIKSLPSESSLAAKHSAKNDRRGLSVNEPPRVKIKDPLVDKLITIHRHTENTDRIVEMVKEGLGHVPVHVKQILADNGYSIVIAPMTMDVTDTQDTKPRGYNNGGGWDNAGGVFLPSTKRVIVGERVSWRCGLPTFNSHVSSTIRHEIGHAYDQYMGKTLLNLSNISSSALFRQTYANEAQILTNTQRRQFEYFVQPDGAGEHELFAELFYAYCFAENENNSRSQSAEALASSFPKTFQLVEDLVEQQGLERFTVSND